MLITKAVGVVSIWTMNHDIVGIGSDFSTFDFRFPAIYKKLTFLFNPSTLQETYTKIMNWRDSLEFPPEVPISR